MKVGDKVELIGEPAEMLKRLQVNMGGQPLTKDDLTGVVTEILEDDRIGIELPAGGYWVVSPAQLRTFEGECCGGKSDE